MLLRAEHSSFRCFPCCSPSPPPPSPSPPPLSPSPRSACSLSAWHTHVSMWRWPAAGGSCDATQQCPPGTTIVSRHAFPAAARLRSPLRQDRRRRARPHPASGVLLQASSASAGPISTATTAAPAISTASCEATTVCAIFLPCAPLHHRPPPPRPPPPAALGTFGNPQSVAALPFAGALINVRHRCCKWGPRVDMPCCPLLPACGLAHASSCASAQLTSDNIPSPPRRPILTPSRPPFCAAG